MLGGSKLTIAYFIYLKVQVYYHVNKCELRLPKRFSTYCQVQFAKLIVKLGSSIVDLKPPNIGIVKPRKRKAGKQTQLF